MVENGYMQDIDMTFMAHPSNRTADMIGKTGVDYKLMILSVEF